MWNLSWNHVNPDKAFFQFPKSSTTNAQIFYDKEPWKLLSLPSDLWFSKWWLWTLLSSGMWHHVWKCGTDVSRGSCCLYIMTPWGWQQHGTLTNYRDSHRTKHCSRHTIIKWPATEFVMQQQEWSDKTPICGTSHSPVVAHLDCRRVWRTDGMKTSMWLTKCFEKNLLQCHLSTANPIWTPLEMNPHLGNGKFLTDCLSYKMALGHVVCTYHITPMQCIIENDLHRPY